MSALSGHTEAWLPLEQREALEAARDQRHQAATDEYVRWHTEARARRRVNERQAAVELEAAEAAASVRLEAEAGMRTARAAQDYEALQTFGLSGATAGGFPVQWCWLQWTGAATFVLEVGTANYHQHVDVIPNQVLLLPREVCVYLQGVSAFWVITTVIPEALSFVHDAASGLDEVYLSSNSPWGVNQNGFPYFDPEGAARGESQRLLVISGLPYLFS